MNKPTCQADRKDGQACQAPALPGGGFCFAHDPTRTADARAARAKGTANSAKVRSLAVKRAKLDSAQALVRFNGDLIEGTLSGSVDPSVSRAVSYAVGNQLRILEVGQLEKRVAELEALYGAGQRRVIR